MKGQMTGKEKSKERQGGTWRATGAEHGRTSALCMTRQWCTITSPRSATAGTSFAASAAVSSGMAWWHSGREGISATEAVLASSCSRQQQAAAGSSRQQQAAVSASVGHLRERDHPGGVPSQPGQVGAAHVPQATVRGVHVVQATREDPRSAVSRRMRLRARSRARAEGGGRRAAAATTNRSAAKQRQGLIGNRECFHQMTQLPISGHSATTAGSAYPASWWTGVGLSPPGILSKYCSAKCLKRPTICCESARNRGEEKGNCAAHAGLRVIIYPTGAPAT